MFGAQMVWCARNGFAFMRPIVVILVGVFLSGYAANLYIIYYLCAQVNDLILGSLRARAGLDCFDVRLLIERGDETDLK